MKLNTEILKTWAFWKTLLFLPFLIYFTLTIFQTIIGIGYNLIFNFSEFNLYNYIPGVIFIMAMPGMNYAVTGLIKNFYASAGLIFPERDLSEEELLEKIKEYEEGDNGI